MRVFTILALAVAIGLGTALSPWASTSPDGLSKVAEDHAFGEQGKLAAIQEDSPVPGYAFPGVENERVAKGLAGFVGTLGVFAFGYGVALGVFAFGYGVAWVIRRRPPRRTEHASA